MRAHFQTARGPHGYAVLQGDETPIGAVIRSIERRTGLVCCAGPRLDSWNDTTTTYEASFGKPIDNGYSVRLSTWIYI